MNKYIFLFLLSLPLVAFNQQLIENGKYNHQLYSIADFGSATQIWTGDQGINHNVYFGNDNTILEFNGIRWTHILCDSSETSANNIEKVYKSKVNKIFTASDGKTYIGRLNNFGYLKHNKKGRVIYKPIKIADSENPFESTLNIVEQNNTIYFICENALFSLKNGKLEHESLLDKYEGYKISSSIKFENYLFIRLTKGDNIVKFVLLDLKTKRISSITNNSGEDLKNSRGIYHYKGKWLIFTSFNNVFTLDISSKQISLNETIQSKLNSSGVLNIIHFKEYHNQLLFGTEFDGLFVLDNEFNFVRQFHLDDGMESLKLNFFFKDNEHNLWLCLDNGIHFFETSSPITNYSKAHGITERIMKVDFRDNFEVFATNTNGIYTAIKENHQKKFKNSDIINQGIYDLNTYQTSFGQKTIAIADQGIYEVDYQTKKNKLLAPELAWKTCQNPENKDEFFVGNESSFGQLNLTAKGWEYKNIITDLSGSILNLIYFKGNIIFGVENVGIYIYNLKSKQYKTLKHSIKTKYKLEAFQNRVYIGLTTGLYYLNNDFTEMLPFVEINRKFIGDLKFAVFRLYNENNKKLWIVTYKDDNQNNTKIETGWLENNSGNWSFTSWPVIGIEIQKGELVYDIKNKNDNEIWFGANKGLFILNKNSIQHIKKTFTVSIDEIKLNNKLLVYNPLFADKINAIPYDSNSINFTFHANTFYGIKNIKFRFRLSEYSDNWSEWSSLNTADFQRLGEGNYTLEIEAKNIYGFISQPYTFSFSILPPWYRTWWAYTLYFIAFVILIYFIVQISIQRVKNQNIKLEEIVKERTSEIAEQNKVLEVQKVEIEQKTKDIVDSIVYAKRIQETILPTERLPDIFKDYFVFYKPKDIVSGDFYWARKKGDIIIFSAIDCTGHGVPGALVSIVGNGALLRCVNEHQLIEPAQILDKLREIVVKSFDTKGAQDVKDGMDMSLCTLDTKTNVLKYAGANNECIIIRNKEIIELKPDKQPIGYFSHATPFSQQEIELIKDDCVYQFTDGYVDQFGGDKGKKLKSRPFKEFLVEISHLPMQKQHQLIQEKFESWKENYDQVDDVCVFGIKIV